MFENRGEAGIKLSFYLEKYRFDNTIVIALPRGGVPVGFEIAKRLRSPLDVLVVRKIGMPFDPELGVGAISEGGGEIINWSFLSNFGISRIALNKIKEKEEVELKIRVKLYRQGKSLPDLGKKLVILVDDGIATGVSMSAALLNIQKADPLKIIIALPICSQDSYQDLLNRLRPQDLIFCLVTQTNVSSISAFYKSFPQVTDGEVMKLLKKSKEFEQSKEKKDFIMPKNWT